MKSIYTKEYEGVVAALVTARKKAGFTQEKLAERLRKPQSYVSKYERRERRLDVVEFVRIARALGIDPAALINEIDLAPTRSRRKQSS